MKLTKNELRELIKEHIAIRDFLEVQYNDIDSIIIKFNKQLKDLKKVK